MVMTPEAWTVIGTGVVVLIAIATSYRHLRAEMKALRDEFRGEMKAVRDEFRGETTRIHADLGGLRERMAKLEGLLEGLREAITGRKAGWSPRRLTAARRNDRWRLVFRWSGGHASKVRVIDHHRKG